VKPAWRRNQAQRDQTFIHDQGVKQSGECAHLE
jgi:hypothetical protein